MPQSIHLRNLDETLRGALESLAAQQGWYIAEALPADLIVLGLSDDASEQGDGVKRAAPHTPVLAVGDGIHRAAQIGAQAHVDGSDPDAVVEAVGMLLDTVHRYAAVHPLTRLPGSPEIVEEIQRRLSDPGRMGCVQFDIDRFKAFNDAYGFERGDRLILALKDLICLCARSHASSEAFIGHIGGDDFILIAPPPQAEAIGRAVVAGFADVSRTLVDESDRDRGFLETLSRTGHSRRFALPTVTAVMVTNEAGDVRHPGRVSAVLAELKAYVKPMEGSNFFKDRRKHHDSGESLARKPK